MHSLLENVIDIFKVVIAVLASVVIITLILKNPELKELDVNFKFLGFEFKTKATYTKEQK